MAQNSISQSKVAIEKEGLERIRDDFWLIAFFRAENSLPEIRPEQFQSQIGKGGADRISAGSLSMGLCWILRNIEATGYLGAVPFSHLSIKLLELNEFETVPILGVWTQNAREKICILRHHLIFFVYLNYLQSMPNPSSVINTGEITERH